MSEIHIPTLKPDTLGSLGPLPITNTVVNTWLAIVVLLIIGIIISRKASLRPKLIQNSLEFFIESLWGYFDQVTGSREKTKRFFPVVGTLFFFILLSNWLGLLPGTGSIFVGHAPLLRPANTDLNLTVAMALITVAASHLMAFASIGVFAHLNKFIQIGTIVKSFRHGPVAIFTAFVQFIVGIIEIFSEIAKVMSLSLRLFGNIFAGEVLISVIGALVGAIVPIPFMMLELLVGLIQASVFAMLALVYLTTASEAPHGTDH